MEVNNIKDYWRHKYKSKFKCCLLVTGSVVNSELRFAQQLLQAAVI